VQHYGIWCCGGYWEAHRTNLVRKGRYGEALRIHRARLHPGNAQLVDVANKAMDAAVGASDWEKVCGLPGLLVTSHGDKSVASMQCVLGQPSRVCDAHTHTHTQAVEYGEAALAGMLSHYGDNSPLVGVQVLRTVFPGCH
jgi:hypothetical protein